MSTAQAKNWRSNTRRRYVVTDGVLRYNSILRKKTGLAAKLADCSRPFIDIPRQGEAWDLVETDHREHHDGHNRTEMRLGKRYLIPQLRALVDYARAQCGPCKTFVSVTKPAVTPIITSRPMQLVMFDLFFLPFADHFGRHIVMMMIDHFTKYKWARAIKTKDMVSVGNFLLDIFRSEGNCERWHCDNGREFINHVVQQAQAILGVDAQSTSAPYNPQCNGCVERCNGTCKQKIIKHGMAEGLANGTENWDWARYLDKVVYQENDCPIKLYMGLTPFYCLRGRERNCTGAAHGVPEALAEMHVFMHKRQQDQGSAITAKGDDPVHYDVGAPVYVRASQKEVKIKTALSGWSTTAVIASVTEHPVPQYHLLWVSHGLSGESAGTISRRHYPWTGLRHREEVKAQVEEPAAALEPNPVASHDSADSTLADPSDAEASDAHELSGTCSHNNGTLTCECVGTDDGPKTMADITRENVAALSGRHALSSYPQTYSAYNYVTLPTCACMIPHHGTCSYSAYNQQQHVIHDPIVRHLRMW